MRTKNPLNTEPDAPLTPEALRTITAVMYLTVRRQASKLVWKQSAGDLAANTMHGDSEWRP